VIRVRRDLGDFQTPPGLVREILAYLGPIGRRWPRVLEPGCGRGHFIAGLLAVSDPPAEIQGIEIQGGHARAARAVSRVGGTPGVRVKVAHRDLFDIDLSRDLRWRGHGPLLVIGNPPWVTNSELGSMENSTRPPRRNIKGLRGLEAVTGSSNFDVTEAIWLKLAFELAQERPTIALLCKTSVARTVLQFAHKAGLAIEMASIHRIDAPRWFGASVDACLFCVTLGAKTDSGPRVQVTPGHAGAITSRTSEPAGPGSLRIPVYADLGQSKPEALMGFAGGWLIADLPSYQDWAIADGVCPMEWRQGMKHDAAAVMELSRDRAHGWWCNRHGEVVDVEPDFIYPLVKGTDLTRPVEGRTDRAILVTQEHLGADTASIADRAPRLWAYLQAHAASFSRRKSSIYRGRPPFSLFGIGPYSFAAYKVAISGMLKRPLFRALGPIDGRPTMLDDTCYFLPCATAEEGAIVAALCNDPLVLGLMSAITFRDAKRPITKKLLQRIDLSAVCHQTDRRELVARATMLLRDELAAQCTLPLLSIALGLEQKWARPATSGMPGGRSSHPA
jgi:hypothetical protein